MSIEVKISKKPITYKKAMLFMNKRVEEVKLGKNNELIWLLEHPTTYSAGVSFNKKDILNKNIKVIKTNRGGKITCHAPGQLVCYLVIDLNKRNKDIRKFIISLENSIINSLNEFKILSKSDRKNIGIWITQNNESKKIGAIGIKVKKWVAYHGFSLNINNDLNYFKKIIPCGLDNKKVTSILKLISFKPRKFENDLAKIFLKNINNI